MQDLGFYFGIGWGHIISKDALDHQLFIAALVAIYLLKDWKQVLILVTAFTIGHSLTLVLSVFDIIRFNSRWVEFLIPLTIVITALSNLYQKKFTAKSVRINYILALVFGLVHGMGFANALGSLGLPQHSYLTSLVMFNVGVELGQLAVIVSAFLLFGKWFGNKPYYRKAIVIPLSILITLVAGYWTIERLFF